MGFLNQHLEYFPKPTFGSDKHAALVYKDREDRRMNEGFENLSGLHYFYMTKMWIKTEQGELIHAPYEDWDEKLINTYLECKKNKWDLIVPKARRKHFTSIMVAAVMYECVVQHIGCNVLFTSCDEDRLINIRNNFIIPAINGSVEEGLCPSDYFYNNDFVKLGSRSDKSKNASTIWWLQTAKDDKSAAKGESFGSTLAILDEWFLHPRADKVELSFRKALMKKTERIGIIVKGGSCNTLTKAAGERLKMAIKEAPITHAKIHFIPGWAGIVVDKYGITDKQAGIDYLTKIRDDYRKGELFDKLAGAVKDDPMTIEEMFESAASDYVSPAIQQNINKGLTAEFAKEPIRCTLLPQHDGTIFHSVDRHGWVWLYDMPVAGHTYIAGLDPIDFTGALKKGSYFCCVIKDLNTNKYVAYMKVRTLDGMAAYNVWHSFLMFYGKKNTEGNIKGALCLAERNRLGTLINICESKGTLELLAFDPRKAIPKDFRQRGYFKADDEKDMTLLMELGRFYLESNVVPFREFNETFIGYPDVKSDIGDAFLSCELLHHYIQSVPVEQKKKRVEKIVRNSQGFLERKIVTVSGNRAISF